MIDCTFIKQFLNKINISQKFNDKQIEKICENLEDFNEVL